MDFKSRKMRILAGFTAAVVLAVGYRIYDNIQAERLRAEKLSQVSAIAVAADFPCRVDIMPELSFSGSLDPEWSAEVAAKVDGRIEKVYVKEGDRVRKGQLLAVLEQVDTDADLLAARGDYMDAQTNLRKAETDLKRYERLFESGAVSRETVDDYRFARENAAAKLDAARGVLQGMESKANATEVIAPADGIIYKRYYQEGYYAQAGTALFAIADIDTLKVTIHIPEGEVSGVAVGSAAQIILPAFADKNVVGSVTSIAPVADQPDHTFQAEVSVDNTQGLLAGVFATVNLQGTARRQVLTVPPAAIVMRDDQKTVFVVDSEGIVKRRVVAVGYTDENYAEILSGLEGDELIVTGGQNKLREGSKVKTDKAGK